ncbi:MAG TPA: Maf family protein [Gammaproteobacteria bacterium]|nr:Maf family protein [Gammaproteobacteria bacterium]
MPAILTLASSSPRRRALLARIGLRFRVEAPRISEAIAAGEDAETLIRRLAGAKAAEVAERIGACALGADTVVVCGAAIFGKPADDEAAEEMLAQLSGREHRVVTAVALAGEGPTAVATSLTRIWFRPLDAATRGRYVASGEGRDAAGAYRIQGAASAFLVRLAGSYSNVVGLPLAETVQLLRNAGLVP